MACRWLSQDLNPDYPMLEAMLFPCYSPLSLRGEAVGGVDGESLSGLHVRRVACPHVVLARAGVYGPVRLQEDRQALLYRCPGGSKHSEYPPW